MKKIDQKLLFNEMLPSGRAAAACKVNSARNWREEKCQKINQNYYSKSKKYPDAEIRI